MKGERASSTTPTPRPRAARACRTRMWTHKEVFQETQLNCAFGTCSEQRLPRYSRAPQCSFAPSLSSWRSWVFFQSCMQYSDVCLSIVEGTKARTRTTRRTKETRLRSSRLGSFSWVRRRDDDDKNRLTRQEGALACFHAGRWFCLPIYLLARCVVANCCCTALLRGRNAQAFNDTTPRPRLQRGEPGESQPPQCDKFNCAHGLSRLWRWNTIFTVDGCKQRRCCPLMEWRAKHPRRNTQTVRFITMQMLRFLLIVLLSR